MRNFAGGVSFLAIARLRGVAVFFSVIFFTGTVEIKS